MKAKSLGLSEATSTKKKSAAPLPFPHLDELGCFLMNSTWPPSSEVFLISSVKASRWAGPVPEAKLEVELAMLVNVPSTA
jgi:hypothetical protein